MLRGALWRYACVTATSVVGSVIFFFLPVSPLPAQNPGIIIGQKLTFNRSRSKLYDIFYFGPDFDAICLVFSWVI